MKVEATIRQYNHTGKSTRIKWRNPSRRKQNSKPWLLLLLLLSSFLVFFFLNSTRFSFRFSLNNHRLNVTSSVTSNRASSTQEELTPEYDKNPCLGRYIYIHHLPGRFNEDVVKNCESLNRPTDKSSMCDNIKNYGFGPEIENSNGVLSNKSWYSTNQFLLEVIFHAKMKKYKCLTNDSSLASAIFIPFYAGLDLRRHLWRFTTSVRDSSGIDLAKWLVERPEWRRNWGKDHFMVAGRISRDFRRKTENNSDWGSKFMLLPESQNMSIMSIESSFTSNEIAIPYPTYFHPSENREILQWQRRMRETKREFLFSFAGAPRSRRKGSVRDLVISQCKSSNKTCRLLGCGGDSASQSCDDPVNVMKLFTSSIFCLQPPGDSYTRRSIFDSILGGCIPVFFHPGSAYEQYFWHLPKNHSEYSVYMPGNQLRDRKFSIEQKLLEITEDRVVALREAVIKLIPRVLYANPGSKLGSFEDAFDIAITRILKRISRAGEESGRS
ncbi:probable xyloglucan galactosyltransferase GT14 [Carica papaya]|uniref:probable xyloglucan galactosyltransferase GT14 n=1 Tax=Carica papaya TaxID=3649 RepID=UPI000B8CFF29|nr:probable xyloglucan galactosyltransferase GT14 [Carica papaya]